MDVYLGNLGPLRLRVYQTTAPGPLTNISPFVSSMPGPQGLEGAPGPSPATGSPLSPTVPPRYIPAGPIHTIVVVEMPPLADIIKVLEDELSSHSHPHPEPSQGARQSPDAGAGASGSSGSHESRNGNGNLSAPPPSTTMATRSLPLLFIRAADGVGYHSGRTIACENVFQGVDLNAMAAANSSNGGPPVDPNWLAAAQAAAAEGGLHGWTLRVM